MTSAIASAPEHLILRITAALDQSTSAQQFKQQSARPSIVVSVIDQGHGIAPEVAAGLFSPFFSTKAEGMGLNICRTTIEFHGGTLTYAHNPTGGILLHFSLPAQGYANLSKTASVKC